MPEIRVGVVGVGHLGRHHARILNSITGAKLVGVVDSRLEQAQAVADPLGVQAYSNYEDLFGKVDAVSIAVPTRYHHAVAGAFLKRKVHTLVEKPLATSVQEAEDLVALAQEAGLILQVGHIERYNPIFESFQKLAITPQYLTAERLSTYTFRSTDIGVVLDLMIHDIDLTLSLIHSPVVAVSAIGTSVFGGGEDVASARIWFENGTVADLSASRVSLHSTRKMRIWGREGYVGLDFKTRESQVVRPSEGLKAGDLSLENVDLANPEAIKRHVFGTLLDVEQNSAEGKEQLAVELQDFIQSVSQGTSPRVTGADGLRNMKVAELIVESVLKHPCDGIPALAVESRQVSSIPAPHLLQTRTLKGSEIGRVPR